MRLHTVSREVGLKMNLRKNVYLENQTFEMDRKICMTWTAAGKVGTLLKNQETQISIEKFLVSVFYL